LWWARPGQQAAGRPQWFRAEALAPSLWGVPAWPIVRTVFGVSAFRLAPPAVASRLEAATTRRRIDAVESKSTTEATDAELLRAWEEDLVNLERAQQQIATLAIENERLQNDLNALLAAFDAAVAAASRSHAERPEAPDTPGTLAEAVKLAAERCANLQFLPEALRSAEDWRYQRPEVVLHALERLDQLAGAWRRSELDGSFIVAARAAGLPWRPAISRTAQTQYRDDYLRTYRGEQVMLGPHLAWGNSPDNAVRAYLYLDRETRTVVVGHVGRHLRDTSNPHL
jgi:hypothetical protein